MGRKKIFAALAFTLIAATAGGPLLAQANISGQIEGTILDGRGRSLPGVTVTLEGPALFGPRAAVTSSEGKFRFPALPIGRYMLKADLVGYQSFVTTDIILNAGEVRNFEMTLFEGLLERVTVVAEQNLIDTRSTHSREVIDADYLNALPLSERRYQQTFSIFPGVTDHSGSTAAQYHLHGGTTYQIGYRIDGATVNGIDTGRFSLNLNLNAIERFEVISGGFQAEYGEQSSGILNAITRSGTNEWQYMYSGFLRNASFTSNQSEIDDLEASLGGARTYNNPINQQQQWHEFSASGPLIKDKLFLFAAAQYWQEDFGGLVQSESGANVNNFRTGSRYNFQIKVNWQVSQDNEMVFNLFSDPAKFENIELVPTVTQGTNRNQSQGGYLFQVRDTHIFSPDTFLETQYFLHHSYLAIRPEEPNGGAFVQDAFSGLFTGAFYADIDNSWDRHRVSSTLTHMRGRHTIKGGLDYTFMDYRANKRQNSWSIDYGSGYFYGLYQYVVIDFGEDANIQRDETEVAAFIQDRISLFDDRVSVDVGLRYQQQSVINDGNVAPRLGVSYDPAGDGRTRIFANWGRFYDSVFFDILDRFEVNDGISFYFANATDCPDPSCAFLYSQTYTAPSDLEQPRKDQWQIGFERELPGNWRVGVTHTEWESKNDIISIFDTSTSENFLVSDGRSDYRGTEITVRKPFGRSFELFGSWTHSRTRSQMTNAEELSFLNPSDPLSTDFSRAGFDRPDVVKLSALLRFPAGFNLTSVYSYQDGRLTSPTETFLNTIDPMFGKNSYRLPPQRRWDLMVSRGFNLGRADLKLRLQVFNVMNEFNVVSIGTRTDVSVGSLNELGTPQIIDIPRTVQAGIELRF